MILNRFPGPITLRALTLRSAVLVTIIMIIVMAPAAGFVLSGADGNSLPQILAFVGLVVWVGMLLRLASLGTLTIGPEGFEILGWHRREMVRWQDVVAFDLRSTAAVKGMTIPIVYCRRSHVGDVRLDMSFFGWIKTRGVVRLMTSWRNRALGADMPDTPASHRGSV